MIFNEMGIIPKDKIIGSVCLLHGEETYLVDKASSLIIANYLSPEEQTINLTYLDGKSVDMEDLESSCETLPFLSEKRITVLRNPGFLIEKESKNERLLDYLLSLGDHQILIIHDNENTIKKNTKVYKQLDKKGYILELQRLKQNDLFEWIQKVLSDMGKKMSFSDLSFLVQQTGYLGRNSSVNLYDIENELKKLAAFSTSETILRDDVERVLVKSIDKNVFDLLTSIGRNDTGKALELFDEMQIMNEPVQRILFMIARQFRLLLGYHSYKNKGYSPSEIQGKLQVKPYEFTKISTQANHFKEKHLKNILESILEVDRRIKTLPVDGRLEMEMLIVSLTNKK